MSKKPSAAQKRKQNETQAPTGAAMWLAGARLRTLPLAAAPVILGTGVAAGVSAFNLPLATLAMLVALFLQVGVNYANDYSDGIRGTDAKRVGPLRLTGSGLVEPRKVKLAAFAFFGLAALAGLAIVGVTQQWWIIRVGIVCVVAAWFYTGGKKPYGYAGLGEIVVFVFFGLVATVGTTYIQIQNWGQIDALSPLAGIALGCFASAVLLVNNIRDIATDLESGKRTIAVKLGAGASKALFVFLIWVPIAIVFAFQLIYSLAAIAFAVALLVGPITVIVLMAKTPKDLITALKLTSLASLAYAVLLAVGISG